MNSLMRRRVDEALEDTLSAIMSVLTYVPTPYHTILLPVPTLQAFLSRTIGLVQCIPEIHQSDFHGKLERIATEFAVKLISIDEKIMLKYLRERDDYKQNAQQLLQLLEEASLIQKLGDSYELTRRIEWETQRSPEMQRWQEWQKKQLDHATKLPLSQLCDKLDEAHKTLARFQGLGEPEPVKRFVTYAIGNVQTIASAKARSLYENSAKYIGKIKSSLTKFKQCAVKALWDITNGNGNASRKRKFEESLE